MSAMGFFAAYKLEKEITSAFSQIMVFEEIDVNLLKDNIIIVQPAFEEQGKKFSAERMELRGLHYYKYLFQDKTLIEKIVLQNPKITVVKKHTDSDKTIPVDPDQQDFRRDIVIQSLKAEDGSIRLKKTDTSGINFFVGIDHFQMEHIRIDSSTVENPVPFLYDSYSFIADSLYLESGKLHYFTAEQVGLENGSFFIDSLRVNPRYNITEFQEHIPYEKDRFDVVIDSISSREVSWEIINDTLRIMSPLISVNGMDMHVYRNKLLPDDNSIKSMYSKKIRNLPIGIDIEKIRLDSSNIVYQEKVKVDRSAIKIDFTGLSATITDLSNFQPENETWPRTVIEAQAAFMSSAPVNITWSFSTEDPGGEFEISGNMGSLSEEALNTFLVPAMGIKSTGGIEAMEFDYSGDNDAATGQMQLKYQNFHINILEEDEQGEIKEFFSTIANFFIDDEGTSGNVKAEDLRVTRNKQKSFWNYLWLMIKEGAIEIFL